jgi:hypothetical protein
MTLLAFSFGRRQSKKLFHSHTTIFGFEFGDDAVSQPIKVSGVFFSYLESESF